jgi:hypothetical protein
MPDDKRYAPNADTTDYASESFAAFSFRLNTLWNFATAIMAEKRH